MSSLRNAVRRREHRERAQPGDRRRYGLLEKHKDYVLRAKDFHKKQKTIQKLQEKAAFKNPDEFYYNMINSKTSNGIHRPKSEAKEYTHEEIMLMKTQDVKYVLNKAQSEQKKIERLQGALHFLHKAPASQHVYFAEDSEEAKELKTCIAGKTDKDPSSSDLPPDVIRERAAAYNELARRKQRLEKLKSIAATMSMQKQTMGKGRKRKLRNDELVVPSSLPVFKWRNERKK